MKILLFLATLLFMTSESYAAPDILKLDGSFVLRDSTMRMSAKLNKVKESDQKVNYAGSVVLTGTNAVPEIVHLTLRLKKLGNQSLSGSSYYQGKAIWLSADGIDSALPAGTKLELGVNFTRAMRVGPRSDEDFEDVVVDDGTATLTVSN